MKIVSIFIFFIFSAFEILANETSDQLAETVIDLLQTKKSEFRIGQKITGIAVFRDKDFDYPVKMQEIALLYENKVILKGSTNLDGRFEFYGNFRKGTYKLQVQSKLYKCEKDVLVPSQNNFYKITCLKKIVKL